MGRWTRRQRLAGGAGAAVAAGGGAYLAWRPKAAPIGFAVSPDALARARALLAVRDFAPGEARASYQRQITHLRALVTDGLLHPVLASHVHIHSRTATHPRFISAFLPRSIAEKGGGVQGARPAGIGITDMRGFVERAFELIGGNFLRVLSAAQRG